MRGNGKNSESETLDFTSPFNTDQSIDEKFGVVSRRNQARRRRHRGTPDDEQLPQFSSREEKKKKAFKVASYYPSHERKHSVGRRFVLRILFLGAVLGIVGYWVLFFRLLIQAHESADMRMGLDPIRLQTFYLNKPDHQRPPPKSQAALQVEDAILSDQRIFENTRRNVEERKRRIQPKSFASDASGIEAYKSLVKPYGFEFLKGMEEEHDSELNHYHDGIHNNENPIRCGIDAINVSTENPLAYPDIHTINEDSVVLIVGILDQLGFHLALKLATDCNVQTIIGVDFMFPNESRYRLELLEQISILYNKVAAFKRPLILGFDGVNPRNKDRSFKEFFNDTNGNFDYATYAAPTHVVHILSEHTFSFHDHSSSNRSPYSRNDGLFGMRQSLMATEQLLSNLGGSSKVHFTFISDIGILKDQSSSDLSDKKKGVYTTSRLMEEVMIQSYSQRLGSSSFVILRIPKLYGPWCKPGSFDHDLAHKAILHWHDKDTMTRAGKSEESRLLLLAGQAEQSAVQHDILFVDDAVNAVVAAMQYASVNAKVATFNIVSGETISKAAFADALESFMPIHTHPKGSPKNDYRIHGQYGKYIHTESALSAKKELNWAPRIYLPEGLKRSLAWHLDNHLPFGPPIPPSVVDNSILAAIETGPSFLIREGHPLCNTDDLYCNRGRNILPCISECSDPIVCTSSPMDRAAEASSLFTEKCEVVLYTAFLKDDTLEFGISAPPDDGNHSICNVAFILASSPLAKILLKNVTDGKDRSVKDGVFLHKGWNIIPISSKENGISQELYQVLKLSPGKFFHSSVKSILYISPDFQTSPEINDVTFTTGLLHRPMNKNPAVWMDHAMEKMHYRVGQTNRDALILFPGAPTSDNPAVKESMDGLHPTISQRVSLSEGLKAVVDQNSWRGNRGTRQHVQFEKKVSAFFNSHDFESQATVTFQFIHRHWVDHYWVAHNLEKVEARNLRCEWYREQIKWEDGNESLSFAHIMARMEVEHFNKLPDGEEEKTAMLEEQSTTDINMETDEYSWHIVKDRYSDEMGYVRILDERGLMIERRLWQMRNSIDSPSLK